jgi:hypothetical protein
MRGKPPETVPVEQAPAEPPPAEAEPPETAPEPESRRRRIGWIVPAAAVPLVLVIGAIATTPYWAPAVMQTLPWGTPPPAPAPAVAAHDDALAARVAALEAAQAKSNQNAASAQALGQRIAALEAKPGPDLTPLQNQLTALAASVADLTQKIGALDKAAQAGPADGAAAALLLLQIDEAVEIGRPFDAEYQALMTLSRGHPDIAAAAAPLAEPAKSGVASRAVLAARLHQLAPQIAAAAPPAKSSWRSQIVARLRSVVTIRRIDGPGQSPAEAAVSNAERALAGGDLKGAVDTLVGLGGANLVAAQPWLGMARQRLAVETALQQIRTLVTAELGEAPAAPAKPG